MSENHDEISRAIGRLEGIIGEVKNNQDTHFQNIQNQFNSQFKLLNEHQNDINSLHLWKAGIAGKITVISAIAGTVVAVLMAFIKDIVSWIKS